MAKLPNINEKVAVKLPPSSAYTTKPLDPSHHPALASLLWAKYPPLYRSYSRAFVTYQRAIHTSTKKLEDKVRKIMIAINYNPEG